MLRETASRTDMVVLWLEEEDRRKSPRFRASSRVVYEVLSPNICWGMRGRRRQNRMPSQREANECRCLSLLVIARVVQIAQHSAVLT